MKDDARKNQCRFTLAFRTDCVLLLCHAVLADDERDETTLGGRWWREAINASIVDYDDEDPYRAGDLTIETAEELQEFFSRLNKYNTQSRERDPEYGTVLTARNLCLRLTVDMEDGPYRASASTTTNDERRWARIEKCNTDQYLRDAMAKIREGLHEIERNQ